MLKKAEKFIYRSVIDCGRILASGLRVGLPMLKLAFIFAFVLTLATWAMVYVFMPKGPLNGPDTTVVFGFWLALASLALWLKKRFSRTKHE